MPSSDTTQLSHMLVKAASVATDQGHFTAIAAAYNVDRVNDRIVPGAFEKTITAWQESGKNIPLHWNHEGEAENIIGYVDHMAERDDGLYVEGQLDIKSSSVAREAWRSMKNNAVALSFGYLAKGREAKDGVRELTEIDLFEVSIVPAPANPSTRLLSLKAMKQLKDVDAVQTYLDENFPGHKIIAVEDAKDDEPKAKSDAQDALLDKAHELAFGPSVPAAKPDAEPEPEPIDPAKAQRDALAMLLD